MAKLLASILLSLFAAALGSRAEAADHTTVHKLHGIYVIDVRSQAEWDAGHIEGAILLPVDEIGTRIESVIPDRSAPIGLYCGSGRRAANAAETLKSMGYKNVENMGGIADARKQLE